MKHCSFLGAKKSNFQHVHLYPCLRFFFLDLIWTLLLFILFYFFWTLLLFLNFYYGKLLTHAKVRESYTAVHFNSDPHMTHPACLCCLPLPHSLHGFQANHRHCNILSVHSSFGHSVWTLLYYFFKVTIFYVSEMCAL